MKDSTKRTIGFIILAPFVILTFGGLFLAFGFWQGLLFLVVGLVVCILIQVAVALIKGEL